MTGYKTFAPGPLCVGCGKCCKSMPGGHAPSDFGADISGGVRRALESGRYTLDWWEGDVVPNGEMYRVLFLRPSIKGKEGQVFDPAWGGECTFLSDTGCSLKRSDMPIECRTLRPMSKPDGQCISEINKERLCELWRPYQSLLVSIADEIEREAA